MLVEFNEQIWNFSSNFKSIGWKLTILDIRRLLTFWSMMALKIIGGWIQWPNMKTLFKFHVNQMKIEDFRNLTSIVDLWPMLTFWSMLISNIIGLLNSVTWNVSRMKIEDFRNLTLVVDLGPLLTSKIIGGWIHWPVCNPPQISSQWVENWGF